MLIEETLFGTVDKVQTSIERLRAFEPKDRPYWLAFSGGKDSCVILELAKMAGVRFEAHYCVTSVDPPELVRFIKKAYPEVSMDIPHDKQGKPVTMWSFISRKKMPPTRFARYCCEELKENAGKEKVTITGVRWAESVNRKANQGMVTIVGRGAEKIKEVREANGIQAKRGIVLNHDNAETRRAVEVCFRTRKTLVNPIIDWEDEDVWEFIHQRGIPYCELYDQGRTRLGCIGCPMGDHAEEEFALYPKYKDMYLRAFTKMIKNRESKGMPNYEWKNADEVMTWWLRKNESKKPTDMVGLFDEEEDE